MSDSLSLSEHLLNRARLMASLGQGPEARRLLTRLLHQPDLPKAARSEGHQMLAGLELLAGNYRAARCQIVKAIRLRRHADELYREYARIVDADPEGNVTRAVRALRQAVGIDPFETRSWTMLGRMAIRAGDRRLAVKALRKAATLRPDAERLGEIVDGLQSLGLEGEARRVMMTARFREPHDVGVLSVHARFEFDRLAESQRGSRGEAQATILRLPEPTSRPVDRIKADPVVLRADRRSRSVPHVLRMFGQRLDPRQAR